MADADLIRKTFAVAERVVELLQMEGVPSAVIGGIALAAHRYPRATADLDLATATDPFTTLARVVEACSAEGWTAKLVTPDAEDPLGGVVTITTAGALAVQIMNYYNPLRLADNPGASAIDTAVASIENIALPVVDLPHLVALKLYAGGPKSEADVVELLSRNMDADLGAIASVCGRFALRDDFARLCVATLGRAP